MASPAEIWRQRDNWDAGAQRIESMGYDALVQAQRENQDLYNRRSAQLSGANQNPETDYDTQRYKFMATDLQGRIARLDTENKAREQQAAELQKQIEAARAASEKAAAEAAKIKAEREVTSRTTGEREASRKRARRGSSGLLAAASMPSLSGERVGPSLGADSMALGASGSSFGSDTLLGTKVKI